MITGTATIADAAMILFQATMYSPLIEAIPIVTVQLSGSLKSSVRLIPELAWRDSRGFPDAAQI